LLSAILLPVFSQCVQPNYATAQDRRRDLARGFPGAGVFDPEQFLEQFFGGDSDEQKKQLAAVPISLEQERRFGEQALQSFLTQLRTRDIRVVRRGPEVEYLESLVRPLKPLMRNARRYRSIRVLLAETEETDARCFPGGTLVIFRGMLAAAQSEAALVAVLGHELSHIDHGHQLRPLKTMKLAQQTFAGPPQGMDFQRMMGNTMLMAKSFARPFRPEEETEADADGVAWAYRLGYDPHEFAKLFLRMARRDAGRDNSVPAFFRTHPYHRDRYEAVVAQLKELQRTHPRDDLYVGQKNLMELVPRSKRRYDE
jgi:predicted Zn-dependent protease